MIDQQAVRYNERLKLIAQTGMAAGAGLSGWAAITIWNAQTLLHAATVWLAVGAAAMAGSVRSLEWLQPEE